MDARNDKLSIPPEATNALPLLQRHLGSSLAAVYLHGSAVAEGLRKRSDVDLLVIVSKALSAPVRARLSADLMCGQSVVTLTEIDRLGRQHDPNPVRGKDHVGPAQARATASIRAADAPSSKRIVTAPTMISGRLAFLKGGSATGGSTTTAANSTASSGAGRTSLPCRAVVRQV